jgi:hypothetical protein
VDEHWAAVSDAQHTGRAMQLQRWFTWQLADGVGARVTRHYPSIDPLPACAVNSGVSMWAPFMSGMKCMPLTIQCVLLRTHSAQRWPLICCGHPYVRTCGIPS